jgi:hypothetical protein
MPRMRDIPLALVIAALVMLAVYPARASAEDATIITTRAEAVALVVHYSGPLRIAEPARPLPREWQPSRQLAGTYRDPFARHVFVRHTHAWYPPYGFGWHGWFGPRVFVHHHHHHHHHVPVYRVPVRPPPIYGPRYLHVP